MIDLFIVGIISAFAAQIFSAAGLFSYRKIKPQKKIRLTVDPDTGTVKEIISGDTIKKELDLSYKAIMKFHR